MAAHAAALTKEVLALGEGPAHIIVHQHHIRGVTILAASFHISSGEQRPEPMLVISVGFFDAGGGAAIALMAWRAAKFIGVVDFQ